MFWNNWRTTICGWTSAILYSVVTYLETGTVTWRGIIISVGIGLLGTLAKDFKTAQDKSAAIDGGAK